MPENPGYDEHDHHHHEMPTGGRELTSVATSATLHCLTGCAIGEVTGMAIGTALGFSDLGTIALAVGLAFLFGYALTSLPLLRAGLAFSAVVPIALAADTFSITVMEVVDNAIMVAVPGAMESGLGDILFWGALSFALFVAFLAALPVNRWLIARGKGHVAIHNTGIHGGPDPRVVGAVLAVAAVFGISVLVAEAVSDDGGHGMDDMSAAAHGGAGAAHGSGHEAGGATRVVLDDDSAQPGEQHALSFRILDEEGAPVTDFEVEHAREMHLIVARRDLTGFQHLHPEMDAAGTWSTPITVEEPGEYRVFADFRSGGRSETLDAPLTVAGRPAYAELPPERSVDRTATGYTVRLAGDSATAGEEEQLDFRVYRDGEPVEVEPYLDADGHLVALREGDLEYLHVHPLESESSASEEAEGNHAHGGEDDHSEDSAAVVPEAISFMTEFPTPGSYRLFLQFRDGRRVHTAEFTQEAGS